MERSEIKCARVLDVRVASETREEWLRMLGTASAVSLDVGEVEQIDTAGVQLLLALERACSESGVAMTRAGASPAVDTALATLGLRAWKA